MNEATSTGIKVKSIDHVTIVVNDLEVSRRFYVDLLGMEPTERPAFEFDGLWFQAGETQVHLLGRLDGAAAPGYTNEDENTLAGLAHHFAFEVDDANAAAEVLKSHGVRIMGGPNRRPDGCIQVWFYDPDGHIVEVFHRPSA